MTPRSLAPTVLLTICALVPVPSLAQLNQNCTVSVLNRTVQVNADGSYVIPNVPANFGPVRARATCVNNGVTTFGQSDLISVGPNGVVNTVTITFGNVTPIPLLLALTAPQTALTAAGATTQIKVTATFSDGSTKDVTPASTGTVYTTTNSSIVSVSADGLATAVSTGTALISASNEGASGIVSIQVVFGPSNGGVPLSWAIANGLDPNDPTMPSQDPDHDGLTNLQEFQAGTNPNNPDTDGDGLTDGEEVNKYHTLPTIADTDGDGIPDGVEIQKGTNPLDPKSYDYATELSGITVAPSAFVLSVNALTNLSSVQLAVTGNVIDGKTKIDLTASTRGTNYATSDVNICNFGGSPGAVFAGNAGSCVITISNSGFPATATGTVQNFAPTALAAVTIPAGYANNVDVSGGYAYVAAGSGGLQVVDVSNHAAPQIVASVVLPGNGYDVTIVGNHAFISSGSGGLQIVDVTNPRVPVVIGSGATGDARSAVVNANLAYVADGANGLKIFDTTILSAPVLLGSLSLTGTSKGLDIDAARQLAIVVGDAGLSVVYVANPATPALLSNLPGGDMRDVAVDGNYAFVADIAQGFTSVNLTDPTHPAISTSLPLTLGGRLQDVVTRGNFALGADVYFPNGVPITDITNPAAPSPIYILNFYGACTGCIDDNATGIAADNTYVYFTAGRDCCEKGVSGDSRLYIGQYQQIVDNGGVPPKVQIVAPVVGPVLIQGQTVSFKVNATDDIAVASVNFIVNSQTVFASSSPPYAIQYTVPSNVTTLNFAATAVDYGSNVGTAKDVLVAVIPDPLTTATGQVVNTSNTPIGGATVTVLGLSTTTAADGSFILQGLPTIRGDIIAIAVGTDNGVAVGGVSAALPPVRGGVTALGTIQAFPGPIITSLSRTEGLTNSVVPGVTVSGINLLNATYAVSPANPAVGIASTSVAPTGTSATLTFTIGSNVSGTFVVVATTPGGSSPSAPIAGNTFRIFNLSPNDDTDHDGLTNAQEVQIGTDPTNADTDGDSYIDGMEVLFGSNPLDPNSIPTIPPSPGYVEFSMLNTIYPSQDLPTPEQPSVFLSMLNRVYPSQDLPVPEQPSVTLSMLNTIYPSQDLPTPEQPSVTLSMLNTIYPSQDLPTPEQPSVTLSFLNSVDPGLNQPSYFEPFVVFSALNTQQSTPNFLSSTFTYRSATGEEVPWRGPASLMALRLLGPTVEARRRLMASFTGPDSDGDGLPDALEIMLGSDPHNADSDGDGLPDGIEYLLKGDPFSARPEDDDDGDGLTNIEEVRLATDPSRADSDGDGLSDGEEVNHYHTDPLRMDTDGDGFPDGLEVALGTDPLDPRSFPSPLQLVPSTIFSKPFTIYNAKKNKMAARNRRGIREHGADNAHKH